MTARIDISYFIKDARAKALSKDFEITSLANSYSFDYDLSDDQALAAAEVLRNPNVEEFVLNSALTRDFDYVLEISYLPGVTDNVGKSASESVGDALGLDLDSKVYSSDLYFVKGIKEEQIANFAAQHHNKLIQAYRCLSADQYLSQGGFEARIPKVILEDSPKYIEVDLDISDAELEILSKEGIVGPDGQARGPLALGLDYMQAIQAYFRKLGRKPRDIELEALAQTWSEHCKHTIFADPIDEVREGLYKAHIKKATNDIRAARGDKDFCISVFSDNAGIIEFDDEHYISHKVETHNSPSALDPFGGAITGIVGVNRDAIGCGLGCKPVANTYGFCFADPDDKRSLYKDSAKTQKMLGPKRILEGVVDGVNVGGNCSGIPTVQGFSYFNERFRGKPLVFVGTTGLIPKTSAGRPSEEKQAQVGDLIVVVGGRVGLDGIHGATFSSVEMDSSSPATAVQIGDPITQKKLSDAIIKEARDRGLYNSITDNGAGGISCSIAEMARECGGCEVELDKVPLKYPGLEAWQIWISESQERMTLSVPESSWTELKTLFDKRDVEATVVGRFTDSGKCIVNYEGETIMDVELDFLHDGLPERQLQTQEPAANYLKDLGIKEEQTILEQAQSANDLNSFSLNVLADLNIASKEFISEQYDHEVQSGSVTKPLQGRGRVNADHSVFRPSLKSERAVALSTALYPELSERDAYWAAAAAIDNAVRNAVIAGANYEKIAILDNFCWCSSNDPERLYQLKQATQACYDFATQYQTPFISGKDSMFNDFSGYEEDGSKVKISAPPTLLITSVGIVEDYRKAQTVDFKFADDLVYIVGADFTNELEFDAQANIQSYKALANSISQALVSSAISIDRGGLFVALAKSTMAGKLAADVDLTNLSGAAKTKLFVQSQGRVLVSVDPAKQKEFEACFTSPLHLIGRVTDSKLTIKDQGQELINLDITTCLETYRSRFRNFLNPQGQEQKEKALI